MLQDLGEPGVPAWVHVVVVRGEVGPLCGGVEEEVPAHVEG